MPAVSEIGLAYRPMLSLALRETGRWITAGLRIFYRRRADAQEGIRARERSDAHPRLIVPQGICAVRASGRMLTPGADGIVEVPVLHVAGCSRRAAGAPLRNGCAMARLSLARPDAYRDPIAEERRLCVRGPFPTTLVDAVDVEKSVRAAVPPASEGSPPCCSPGHMVAQKREALPQ